jgi:hypothetical protein
LNVPLRDAEIEEACGTVSADHDVLRRDIAMNDVKRSAKLVRRLVRRVQSREDLARDRGRDRNGHMSTGGARILQEERERRAVDVLLDEHHLVAERDDIDDLHDVAVPDLRRYARLVEKHRDKLAVLDQLGVHALGRNDARKPDVAQEARDVDRSHSATRDLAMEEVSADLDGFAHSKNWMELPSLQK